MKSYLNYSLMFCHHLIFKLQILVFIFILVLTVSAQEPQVEESQLAVGVKTERTISGQAFHGYVIELKRGQVLRFNFLEKGAGVRAFVMRVNDERVVSAAANSGKGGFMQESLTMVADQDGSYVLFVIAEQVTAPNNEAKYEFTSALSNFASNSDIQRIQAEILLQEVNQLYISNDKDKLPLVITKLEESIKIWRALGDRYWEGISKIYLGESYFHTQNFSKAQSNFVEALSLFEKVKNQAEVGYIYANLAGYYSTIKNEGESRIYANESLTIFKRLGDGQLEKLVNTLTLGNLADLKIDEKTFKLFDYEKAIAETRAKRDRVGELSTWAKFLISFGISGDGASIEFKINSDLQFSERIKERNRKIIGFLERAENEALPLAIQIKDRNLELQILVGLGLGFSELADDVSDENGTKSYSGKSKSYLIQGLALAKISNNQIFEAIAYAGLNRVYFDDESDKLGIYFGKRFINSIQNFRQTTKVADKETQQLLNKESEGLYEELASQLISQNRLPEVLQVLNMGRDKEFYDFNFFTNQNSAKIKLTRLEAENEVSFDSLVNNVGSRYSTNPNSNYQLIANELNILVQKFNVDSLDKDKFVKVRDLDEMQESLSELNNKTGRKHVSIYYFHEEGESVRLLLITPKEILVFSGGDKSDEEILEFLNILRSPEDGSSGHDPRPIGGKIYKNIFEAQREIGEDIGDINLEQALENYGADVIHWSLAGKIRYIPIAALYDERNKQYLVEKYENVVFTRAGKDRFLSEQKPWTQGLGFGTSDSHTVGADRFSPLTFVPQELNAIFGDTSSGQGNYFKGQRFLNKSFTRQSLLAIQQTKPAFVHIASHFKFEAGDAGKSFLLLGDGSTLSLTDLAQNIGLFQGVDLLTLSACETAAQRSDAATGKEIDGLAELAQYLGASSVIATLWKIDDPRTSELMAEFYRIRKDNSDVSKSEALRLAQLNFLNGKSTWKEGLERRSSRGVGVRISTTTKNRIEFKPSKESPFEHPYYWAPFVFYGNSNSSKTSEYIQSKPKPPPRTNNLGRIKEINSNDLIGAWEGLFDQDQYYAVLEIQKFEGNLFYGVLKPKDALIEVKGFIDPATRQISITETRIISLGSSQGWTLGQNIGAFSDDGATIAGTGVGGNVSYKWSFTKKNFSFNSNSFSTPHNVTLNDIETRFKINQYDETIRLGNIFVQNTPNNKEANTYLGLSYFAKRDANNATNYLEKAIRLGQPISITVKRLRIPLLGHAFEEARITIGSDGLAIASGESTFFARYSDLTEFRQNSYVNNFVTLCGTVFLKGEFTEFKANSEKRKQGKKQFDLFPNSAYLQQKLVGQIMINEAACNNQEDFVPTTIVNLISRFK